MPDRLAYTVHNIGIYLREVRGRPPAAAATLERQLGGFESDDARGIEYRVIVDDFDRMPAADAPLRAAPEFGLYQDGLFINLRGRLATQHSGNTLFVWATRTSPLTATFLLESLLLPQGKTFIHAAAVSVGGKGLLFPALGGVGKTALIAHLLERPDVKLLGDDYVVLGRDGALWGYPAPFTLYAHHRAVFPEFFRSASLRILPGALPFRALRRALDLLGLWRRLERRLPVEYAVVPVSALYPPDRLQTSPVPVSAVYILQRIQGADRVHVRPATIDEVSTFAGNVLLYEWHPLARALLAQLALGGAAVSGFLREVQDTVAEGLRQASDLRVVDLPLRLTASEVGAAVASAVFADSPGSGMSDERAPWTYR